MRSSIFYRTASTPILLIVMLLAVAISTQFIGSGPFSRTIVEMFIRVMLVVGLYILSAIPASSVSGISASCASGPTPRLGSRYRP